MSISFAAKRRMSAGFSPGAARDGNFEMYVSGGFREQGVGLSFDPKAAAPVQPGSPGGYESRSALFRLSKANEVSRADYNNGKAALYPTGLR